MFKRFISSVVGAAFIVASSTGNGAGATPTVEELWQMVQVQQRELEQLREELNSTRSQTSHVEIQMLENSERIEAVGEVLDRPDSLGRGSWTERTTIGGYGEMLYNDRTSAASSKELDIQRFVLFFSHEFNDDLRFFSELEIEHSLISDDAMMSLLMATPL